MIENKPIKSTKSKKDQNEEYMNILQQKCEKLIPVIKKTKKITDETIIMPDLNTYNELFKYNYNSQQLKIFAKNYKIKTTGNKQQLIVRIFSFLKLSCDVLKIQKICRGYIQRKYNKIQGPAFIKRSLCTNDSDFLTGEEIKDIPNTQFISFSDSDGFIYGFDIISLYNLLLNSGKKIKNPYNRNDIPPYVISNIKAFIRLSRILNIKLDIDIPDDTIDLSDEKTIELRALTLFQNIDALGNYSSPNWFLSLNRTLTIKMLRELLDIWNYRAQITSETRRKICPPSGILSTNVTLYSIFNEQNLCRMKRYILEIMERLVNSGVDQDSRYLGAIYILGALTIVNQEASTALPWLFQTFSYFN